MGRAAPAACRARRRWPGPAALRPRRGQVRARRRGRPPGGEGAHLPCRAVRVPAGGGQHPAHQTPMPGGSGGAEAWLLVLSFLLVPC